MDLSYSDEYEAFRAEVAKFLAANWPLKGKEAELPGDQRASVFRGRVGEQVEIRIADQEQPFPRRIRSRSSDEIPFGREVVDGGTLLDEKAAVAVGQRRQVHQVQ